MLTDLARVRPFEDLSAADLTLIEPYFYSSMHAAGDVLFSQDEPADKLYIVMDGDIAVRYKPYDAPEITVTHLHKGDVLGWSTALGNSSYTSSAVCTTDVSVLQITGANLRNLITKHPQTGTMVMDRLATAVSPRWKDTQRQVRSLLRAQ